MRRINIKLKFIHIMLLCLFLLTGCKNEKKEYKYIKAYVYLVKPIHWGRGFFKWKIYYKFSYDSKQIKGQDYFSYMTLISGKPISEGDSVLIKFSKENVLENEFIKRVYIKSNNFHIN